MGTDNIKNPSQASHRTWLMMEEVYGGWSAVKQFDMYVQKAHSK